MKLKDLKLTPRRLGLLEKMGIHTLEDLLQTYPLRYEDIAASHPDAWQVNDTVAFEGIISSPPTVFRMANGQSRTVFRVYAFERELEITLFNRPWTSAFRFNASITVFGMYQGKQKVVASSFNSKPLAQQTGIRAVYSLPKEMKQTEMRAILKKALPFVETLPVLVPERLRARYQLLDHARALYWIHEPPSQQALHEAIRTLKYEEFLTFQCVLQASQNRHTSSKPPKQIDLFRLEEKIRQLPYTLTVDQRQALQDIVQDMSSSRQMYRLVQGDVGCGKTAVAALSLYGASLAGYQSALLAPTEILARQHLANLKKMNLEAGLLTSSMPKAAIREVKARLKAGSLDIVVGTHSLFQEGVEFERLGLVIADEQQRFGVRQRRALIEKGYQTDFLMMSATPIPRTYAHFLFGDIQMSSIHTTPPGRQPVKTRFVPGSSMGPILPEVLQAIRQGRQVYVVCPAVEDNPENNLHSAKAIYEGMSRTLKGKIQIGLLHGKMKAEEKEAIMDRFARQEMDILVATTVVEVGIDVPNATMMVIYDAHRFGLSTLHQLRGRAARGKIQGECFLLSDTKDPQARQRLLKLEEMVDGFAISSYDLSLRGPGDLLGTRQSGLPAFILGDYEKDPAIMEAAVVDAADILQRQQDRPMLEYVRRAQEQARYMD